VRRITTFTSVTLDGVMQAPGRQDEDRRGGFDHGGWATPYAESIMAAGVGPGMGTGGALLFGRRTYEDFYSVWPNRTDNPFTPALNAAHKYVASKTLAEPLPWMNSTLLNGDAAEAVARLKEEPGPDLLILGSGELIRSLMRRDLIDEFMLLIHPLVLGSGQRLFGDDGPLARLHLVDTKTTTAGVVIATYRPTERTPQ
jgi:dihydrofolate reductase